MYRVSIVTHPSEIEPYIKNNTVTVLSSKSSGPIGMMFYDLETNLKDEMHAISGEPHKFTLPASLLEEYNVKDFHAMCDAYFQMMLGIMPNGYESHSYANHDIIHMYPIYKGDYIYLRNEEKNYLLTNAINMLGYYPISTDGLIFKEGKPVNNPIRWGSACIIETRQADIPTILKAEESRERMEYMKRVGYEYHSKDLGVSGEATISLSYDNSNNELGSIYHDVSPPEQSCRIRNTPNYAYER